MDKTYAIIEKQTGIEINFDEDDNMYFILDGSKYPLDDPQEILVQRLISVIHKYLSITEVLQNKLRENRIGKNEL